MLHPSIFFFIFDLSGYWKLLWPNPTQRCIFGIYTINMCFSATASFGSGAVLAVIGVVTLKITRKPSHLVFAFIPVLFAIQQISEGFVWLSLQNNEYAKWQTIPIHIFMVFAHIVWPFWITLSAWLLEKQGVRK